MSAEVVKAFVTVKEMLEDRGVAAPGLGAYSDAEIVALCKHEHIFLLEANDDLKVLFYLHNKFKIQDMRKFLTEKKKHILIFKEKINNLNVRGIRDQNPNVEIFMLKDLLFNVSRHEFVPRHEVISDPEEIGAIMRTYDLKYKTQMPIILRTDPMSRYLDIKSGEIVRITRNSVAAGESLVYRVCV